MRLQKELNKHGLHHNSIRRSLFDNFLLSVGNERHFQDYLLLCTGYINDDEFNQRLAKILRVFEFTLQGNYSYGTLFSLHKDWHSFFKENAYPCGNAFDGRCGVERERVDRIMRIYNSGVKDLTECIMMEAAARCQESNS